MKMSRLSLWLKGIGWCLIAGFHLIIFSIVVSSCATSREQNIGSFKENPGITQGFQSHQYLPGYTYYFAGLMSKPEAIVGIHGDYRIQENSDWGSTSTSWKELKTTTENLKSLVEGIDKNKRPDRKPYGVLLSDPAGKQVGILYVTINRNYQPRIRVLEGNRVNVVASVYVGPPISAR
jgi:hypothetical protein